MTSPVESFRTIVTRLRRARGWSVEELAFRVWLARDLGGRGVSVSLVQKRLAKNSRTPPSIDLMRSIAVVLDVDPAVFAEYRLALARARLDERAVGLAAAVAHLERIERPRIASQE